MALLHACHCAIRAMQGGAAKGAPKATPGKGKEAPKGTPAKGRAAPEPPKATPSKAPPRGREAPKVTPKAAPRAAPGKAAAAKEAARAPAAGARTGDVALRQAAEAIKKRARGRPAKVGAVTPRIGFRACKGTAAAGG